jgi:hypothetical protein
MDCVGEMLKGVEGIFEEGGDACGGCDYVMSECEADKMGARQFTADDDGAMPVGVSVWGSNARVTKVVR